ncbi:MAG: MFS transporter, partial [Salinarchaeum sp.]
GILAAAPVAVAFAWSVRSVDPTRPEERIRDRIELAPLLALLTRPAIALTTGLAVCGAFVWQSTSSFLPAFLIKYHGYSEPAAGAMFSVYFAVQGLGQPAIGSLSDRIGRYPAAAVAVAAGVVGYGLFVVATDWWQLLAAATLAGIAMSWGAALLPNIMDHLTEAERGVGFGLIRTTYMVLGASGSLVTGWVSEQFGWQAAFLLLTVLLGGFLIVLIGWLVRVRLRTPPAGVPEGGD